MALTDQVLMPGSDYQAICDNVRRLNGDPSQNIKSGEVVSKLASIPVKTSTDLTASGATVTVPAGRYTAQATKSVATATQATPSISVSPSGLITASATQSAGYVTAGTKSATKQLPVVDAADIASGIGVSLNSVTGNKARIDITSSTEEIANSYIQESPDATSFGFVTIPTETKTVALSMASGNQTITNTDGKLMTSVTIQQPLTLQEQNIRKNIKIGGITGNLEEKHSVYVFNSGLGPLTSTQNGSFNKLFYSNGTLYSKINFSTILASNITKIYKIDTITYYTEEDETPLLVYSNNTWANVKYQKVAFLGAPIGTLSNILKNVATSYEEQADALYNHFESSRSVTANGTYSYEPSWPYDALSKVTVNVDVPTLDLPFTLIKTLTIDDGVVTFTSSTSYSLLIAKPANSTAVQFAAFNSLKTDGGLSAVGSSDGSATFLIGVEYVNKTFSNSIYTYTWTVASSSSSDFYENTILIYGK